MMLHGEGYGGRISGTMRDCNQERNAEFLAMVLKSRSHHLDQAERKSLIGCVIESRSGTVLQESAAPLEHFDLYHM